MVFVTYGTVSSSTNRPQCLRRSRASAHVAGSLALFARLFALFRRAIAPALGLVLEALFGLLFVLARTPGIICGGAGQRRACRLVAGARPVPWVAVVLASLNLETSGKYRSPVVHAVTYGAHGRRGRRGRRRRRWRWRRRWWRWWAGWGRPRRRRRGRRRRWARRGTFAVRGDVAVEAPRSALAVLADPVTPWEWG